MSVFKVEITLFPIYLELKNRKVKKIQYFFIPTNV